MPLAAYKVLHILGVVLLFSGVGALCAAAMTNPDSDRVRKLASMLHGIALLVILISGFGALAKLGFGTAIPAWIWIKLVIFVILGGAGAVIKRAPQHAAKLLVILPLLGALASYLAIYKVGSG